MSNPLSRLAIFLLTSASVAISTTEARRWGGSGARRTYIEDVDDDDDNDECDVTRPPLTIPPLLKPTGVDGYITAGPAPAEEACAVVYELLGSIFGKYCASNGFKEVSTCCLKVS